MNSTLSALEYIEENQLLQKEQDDSLRLIYVTLVYKVIKFKKHRFGFEDALRTYTERESIIDSVTANESESKSADIMVYEQLAKLHEELENYQKAKACHKKFLSLERDDFRCNGGSDEMRSQCSYFEIGDEYYLMGQYKQAAQYLELAYQHEMNSLTKMNKFFLLADLAVLNTDLNQTKVETYSREMHTMLQDDLLTASDIYKNRATITITIRDLHGVNLRDIGDDLEIKLMEVILDVESHANSTICSQQNDHKTLKVLEHCYEQRKYNKTIQLGNIFLEKLRTCYKLSQVNTIKIKPSMLVAKSVFWSGSYSEGMDKMEQLLQLQRSMGPWLYQVYKKEFSEICFYLIPRLKHIATCYPWVYSISHYMSIVVYTVFAIPLQHPSYYQEHNNFPSPPPKSTVPEKTIHSLSKDIAISGKFELSNVDYIQSSVSYIVSVKDWFINNLKWLWGILIMTSQNIVFIFLFNTITVFIRLYIFLFIVLLITLIMIHFCLFLFAAFFVATFLIVIKFRNSFLFPLTLIFIHYELHILEFLLACRQNYLHIFHFTLFGINNYHQLASRRGKILFIQLYATITVYY